jgi:branched-chain amino acid aminotransferase
MISVPKPRIERAAVSRRAGVDPAAVAFSEVFSDHMLTADYHDGRWQAAAIRPYGPLPLAPAISALHYGISVFEGLKAHRLPDGAVALFRPDANARRLNQSAARLAMPGVPVELFLDGMTTLVSLDAAWVPAHGQGALYIRPVLFSVDESIRVKPAERYLFAIVTFPFSAYYAAPVDVLVTDHYVRAFPGGTGAVKPAGNYAPALAADAEARDAGCQTVLWLDGRERRYIEECGVMNIFFVIDGTVVTPSLQGTILPGITRESAIALLEADGRRVEQRPIAIDELLDAHHRGRLSECFGTGTAATLTHVRSIRYRQEQIVLPDVESRVIGPALRTRLIGIATGETPDRYGWLRRVTEQPAEEGTR